MNILSPTAVLAALLACAAPLAAPIAAQDSKPSELKPAQGKMVRVPPPDVERPSGGVPESLRVSLTPDEMREDVDTWKTGLQEYCAGLYRYVDEEELDRIFEELDAKLDNELPFLVFYRELMKVCAKLRHQRVSIIMPARMSSRAFGKESNVLPLQVHIEGQRLFAIRNLEDVSNVPPGSEILEIEGIPSAALLQQIYDGMPSEGFTTTSKARRLELGFPLYYALLVDETLAEYDVVYKTPEGEEVSATLPGVLGKAAFDLAKPHEGQDLLAIELLDELDAAILTVRSLYERDLKSAGLDYETFVDAVFLELESKGVENLVLDLRGNERGSDQHGVHLVSHLVSEPFRYMNYVRVAPSYTGNRDTAERSDGVTVVFPYAGMGPQQPHETHFKGNLIVLIDGATFGTASDVAAVLHRLGRATFVGEATGGAYDGSTIGTSEKVVMPNSRMAADVPNLDFELYGGSADLFGVGVPPDHAVTFTAADRVAGRDTVRDYVLEKLLKN